MGPIRAEISDDVDEIMSARPIYFNEEAQRTKSIKRERERAKESAKMGTLTSLNRQKQQIGRAQAPAGAW